MYLWYVLDQMKMVSPPGVPKFFSYFKLFRRRRPTISILESVVGGVRANDITAIVSIRGASNLESLPLPPLWE